MGKPKRHGKSFRTKRQAEDFRLEKIQEFKMGIKRNRPEEVTLGRLCEDYLVRKPKPVYKKWQRFRKAGKEWKNRYMVNNVLRDFKVKTKRAGIRSNGKFTNHTVRKTCA